MSEVKVSVIVPVYNVEKYLDEALNSLHNQTLEDLEFLVVNDGSTDSSLEIIEKFAKKDKRFKVFDVENGGIGKAFNLGVENATGEYVAEFESDDYVTPNAYERLYETAKQFDVDIVRCNWTEFSDYGYVERDVLYQYPTLYGKEIDLSTTDMIVQVYPWNAIYRREMMISNGVKWDESIKSYGDTGLFWKTNLAAKNVVFIKDSLYFYRQDNPNSTVNNLGTKANFLFQQFDLIRQSLIASGEFDRYKKYFYEQMFEKYMWCIDKLTEYRDSGVYSILDKIAADFQRALDVGNINDSEFKYIQDFFQIANNADQYYDLYLKNRYKVSVVMPVHNSELYLRKTLENVLGQTLKEIEVILVENGSTDNSLAIIEEFAKFDPRLTYVSIGKSNPGHARNVGIEMARGRYLQFLDSDDEFASNLLQEVYYRAYDMSSDILVFGMREKAINGVISDVHNALLYRGGRILGKDINLNETTPYLYDKLFLMDYVKSHNLRNLEQFVGEDAYFTYTALLGTDKIASLDKRLLTRIVRKNGLMSTYSKNYKNEFNLHSSMIKWLKENMPDRIEEYRIKIVNTLCWFLFDMDRVDAEFKYNFYSELKDTYIEELGLDELKIEKYSYDLGLQDRVKRINDISKYSYETYRTIYPDFGQRKTSVVPNVNIQERGGRLIFGQPKTMGKDTVIDMFSIIISDNNTSNASAVIDFSYIGDNNIFLHDSLLLSILIRERNGVLESVVLQANWEKGYDLFKENIFYEFENNVFTVYVAYTERYAAFDYSFRILTSREGEDHFSVIKHNQGYIPDSMLQITSNLVKVSDVENISQINSKQVKKNKDGVVRKAKRIIKNIKM